MISSDLCNAIKKILDKISFHRHFKKAFDTIDHSILFSKLELNGITGNALSMIRSYLSGRNKKCQFVDKMSTARRIECGIPKGSILGPLFFLIIIY